MFELRKVEKSLLLKIIMMTMLLMGTTGAFDHLEAREKGDRSGKRGGFFGFSSSLKLTTTTQVARAVTIQKDYVNREIVAIQEEAAQGEGTHLEALALLLKEEDAASFSQWMQSHYQALFADLNHPEELLTRVRRFRAVGI